MTIWKHRKKKTERGKKSSLIRLWENIKPLDTHVIGVRKGKNADRN